MNKYGAKWYQENRREALTPEVKLRESKGLCLVSSDDGTAING
jgi:hypothetical protein